MDIVGSAVASKYFLLAWVTFWIIVIVGLSYVGRNLWRAYKRKYRAMRDIEIPLGAEATLPMSLCEQLRYREEHPVFDEPCHICKKRVSLGGSAFSDLTCCCVNRDCPIAG